MRQMSQDEIAYWRNELNKPQPKKLSNFKRKQRLKNVLSTIVRISFRLASYITMIFGFLMMLGLPVGLYGAWKEYVFISSGKGGFFDIPEYGLVFLFIVVPVSSIAISAIFKFIAERLEPESILGNING